MKTLKQFREEYDNKYVSQNDVPESMVLEEKSKSLMKQDTPSVAKMPALLLFRRVAYKQYPQHQTVALYYSKMVDKYLSVPFGPEGNLNLSEATVYDTMEELEEGAKWEATKGALSGGIHGAIRGSFMGAAIAPGPGTAIGGVVGGLRGAYKGAKKGLEKAKEQGIKEIFRARLEEKRNERLDENPLAAIARGIGGWALKKGIQALTGKSDDEKDKTKEAPKDEPSKALSTGLLRDKPRAKKAETHASEDRVTAARLKGADLAQIKSVKENKISDLRKMVKENVDTMDININGRPITLNTTMAKRILEVYDSVNTKNKKIVEGMLNENLESFKKLLNFTIRN